MSKVYLEIMRPANCLMAGLAAVVGLLIANPHPHPHIALLVLATVFLVTGGGNAINDYFDRDIDALNRPGRPIPSGRMDPSAARTWSFALFLGGCAISALLNIPCLAIALANSALLYIYARPLKGTPLLGNLCVGYLTGSTFLFGGLACGSPGPTAYLALLAGLATVSREIAKDVEDMEGDRLGNARTLPIIVGERPSAVLGSSLALLAVALSYLPSLGPAYLALVTVADAILLLSTWRLLHGDATGAQKALKGGMAVALLAFLAGALA